MKREKYVFEPDDRFGWEPDEKEQKMNTILMTAGWTILGVLVLMVAISQMYLAVRG